MESVFKDNILSGKVAVVSGGSSGIGLEISRQLGLHGAAVVIIGRRKEALEEAAASMRLQGIRCDYQQGDVRSFDSCTAVVRQAVDRFGSLDVLVNCAAGNFLAQAEKLSPNGFKTVIDIDLQGTFNMSRAAFEFLQASREGCIINISATLHYTATFFQAHASAAKAAIDSLTRSLALEWGQHNIRVVGVAPGPIADTAGTAKLAPGTGQELMKKGIPLQRMGQKTDIAFACVYLASKAAQFITGHTVVVDGAEWIYRVPAIASQDVAKMSRQIEQKSRNTGLASKL